jgi:hypothetical protein
MSLNPLNATVLERLQAQPSGGLTYDKKSGIIKGEIYSPLPNPSNKFVTNHVVN